MRESLADDKHNERAGQDVTIRRAMTMPGGDEKHVMRFCIKGHRSSSGLRKDIFQHSEFVG